MPRLKWWAWLAIAFIVVFAGTDVFLWVQYTEAVSAGAASPASGAYLTSRTVTVTWALKNYRPGRGRVTLSVDGQAVPSPRLSLTSQGAQAEVTLGEGTHQLAMDYTSHDPFSLHLSRSWVVTVDTAPPALQLLSPLPATLFQWKTTHLEALSSQPVVSAALALDGERVPVTIAGEMVSADVSASPGSHELELTVTDRAGNKATTRWRARADFDNPAVKSLVPPKIQAKSAILMDMDSDRVLYSHNANSRRLMGSTTKIMTALLVLDTLPLNQEVTVSARAASVGQQSLGLKAGDRLTVEQLLYGALVHSGNDAAFALAEACSGSMAAFVGRMNEKAGELGLSNTHYVNPDGLDAPTEYSSAADLATLARVAMERPEFRRIVGTVNYSILLPGNSVPFAFRNVNKLLGTVSWVTGIKTGSTSGAGFCLVASGAKDGTSLISVVLGESSWTPTWANSQALLDYGFKWEQVAAQPVPASPVTPVKDVSLAQPSVAVAALPVPYHSGAELELVTKDGLHVTIPQGAKVKSAVTLSSTLTLPVQAGQVLGREQFTVAGQPVGWVDVVAATSVGRATLCVKLAYLWHRVVHELGRVF